uniref:Uncharacterized protein n=1 Tax=Anguilla anguilla TaxID=7936 RepID=A0A0E9SYI2_ANGAN
MSLYCDFSGSRINDNKSKLFRFPLSTTEYINSLFTPSSASVALRVIMDVPTGTFSYTRTL